MPRRKKSAQVRVISGTDRPDRREPEPELAGDLLEEAPPPPDWMPNAHAVNEWNRLAPILVNTKRLPAAATSSLAVLCALYGKLVQLFNAGETPTGHMLAQYNKLVDSFGIPPMAAGKVKPVGDGEKGNKFSKFKGSQKKGS